MPRSDTGTGVCGHMWSQTLVCRLRRAPGGAGGMRAGRQQRRRRRRSGGRGPPDAGRGCPPACHGPPCGRRDTRTRPQTDRQAGAGAYCQGFAGGTHQGRSGGAFLVDKLSAPQRATPYSFERGRRPAGGTYRHLSGAHNMFPFPARNNPRKKSVPQRAGGKRGPPPEALSCGNARVAAAAACTTIRKCVTFYE